jgi:ABC-type multidrug transport system ATPase subunit
LHGHHAATNIHATAAGMIPRRVGITLPTRRCPKCSSGIAARSGRGASPTRELVADAIKVGLRMTLSNSAVVVADGVVKQFGRFAALRGVTAEFAPGRLYVVQGDNGAGKTTLLRTIAGLTRPTRGEISVLGTKDLRNVRGDVGYMAHPSLLYDEMNAMENLRYFAVLYGVEAARCREVISWVKLDPDLERPVGQYSQGMRQRLSLARALLNDPTLLLLDEPFSNVDARSAHGMATLLGELRDHEKTLLVVTHQPALLESVANEFVWMESGKITARTPTLQAASR